MKFNRKIRSMLAFAKFCVEYKCDPYELAILYDLVVKAHHKWEFLCTQSKHQEAYNIATDKVREQAIKMGFVAEFHGMWATIYLNGIDTNFPDF